MGTSRTTSAALLGLGKILVSLSNVLLAAILSRLLDRHSYGLFREILLITTAVTPLFRLGTTESLYYFLPREPERSATLVTAGLLLVWFGSAIWALAMLLGANVWLAGLFRQPDLASLLLLSGLLGFASFPNNVISNCIIASGRIPWFAPYTVAARIIVVACTIAGALTCCNASCALQGNLAGETLSLILGLIVLYRACCKWDGWPHSADFRRQFHMGLPIAVATFAALFSGHLGGFLVPVFFNAEALAVYVNGALQVPVVPVIVASTTAVLLRDMAHYVSTDDDAEAISLFRRTAEKTAILLLPFFGFSLVFADAIMITLYGPQYAESAVPFRILTLALPASIIHFQPALLAKGKSGELLARSAGKATLNVLVSIPMMYCMGPNGAAWGAVTATYAADALWITWRISALYGVQPTQVLPWRTIVSECTVSLVLAFAAWSVCLVVPTADALIRLLVAATVFSSTWALYHRRFLATLPFYPRRWRA